MKDFLICFNRQDIENILEDENEMNYFSVHVNFLELKNQNEELASCLLANPKQNMILWNKALIEAQQEILKSIKGDRVYMMSLKTRVRIRFKNLSNINDIEKNYFPNENDFKKLIQFKGTVVRMTQARMLEIKREYKCLKCKHVVTVHANYSKMFLIEPLIRCKNPAGKCKSSKIVSLDDNKLGPDNCIDYQELKIQEQMRNQGAGSLPSTIWVTLEEDLVDSCQPGDDVIICGIVERRWRYIALNKHLDVSLAIRANSLTVCTTKTLDSENDIQTQDSWINKFWSDYHKISDVTYARDVIINNFCPEIYGMYIIKLALVLTMIGGVSISNNSKQQNNTKFSMASDEPIRSSQMFSTQKVVSQEDNKSDISVRGQSHLLLIGDPGTGKSELLKFAQKLCSRSVLTTGIGSSSAGLTVAAVREANEWNLEAGALVLCDGGICFIDEFTSMKEQDRASIHEAMEQQTISIAKAGMVCKLSTRCSVIAAANPKKRYNQLDSISANIGIAPPLLSRFDLIFILKDKRDPNWDEMVANHILFGEKFDMETSVIDHEKWTMKMFKSYFEFVQNINPVMTEDAKVILSAYYQFKRMSQYRDASRTTVRLLDSLIRLSQAHARLMFKKYVETLDAVTAIILVEYSMLSDNSSGEIPLVQLQDAIKANKIENYNELQQQVIRKLGVRDLIKNVKYDSLAISKGFVVDARSSKIVLDKNKMNSKRDVVSAKNMREEGEELLQKKSDLGSIRNIIDEIRSKNLSNPGTTSLRSGYNKENADEMKCTKGTDDKRKQTDADSRKNKIENIDLSTSVYLEDLLQESSDVSGNFMKKFRSNKTENKNLKGRIFTNKFVRCSNESGNTCNISTSSNEKGLSLMNQKERSHIENASPLAKIVAEDEELSVEKNACVSKKNRFQSFGFQKTMDKLQSCQKSDDAETHSDVTDIKTLVNELRMSKNECDEENKNLQQVTKSSNLFKFKPPLKRTALGMFSNTDDIDDILEINCDTASQGVSINNDIKEHEKSNDIVGINNDDNSNSNMEGFSIVNSNAKKQQDKTRTSKFDDILVIGGSTKKQKLSGDECQAIIDDIFDNKVAKKRGMSDDECDINSDSFGFNHGAKQTKTSSDNCNPKKGVNDVFNENLERVANKQVNESDAIQRDKQTGDTVRQEKKNNGSLSLSGDTAYDSAVTDEPTQKSASGTQRSLTLFGNTDDDYDFLDL